MDVAQLLNEVATAVEAAKAKYDTVADLRAELAAYTTAKQADIDAAQQEYDDAKVAADRLQANARDYIGQILPAPDPRFRVST